MLKPNRIIYVVLYFVGSRFHHLFRYRYFLYFSRIVESECPAERKQSDVCPSVYPWH